MRVVLPFVVLSLFCSGYATGEDDSRFIDVRVTTDSFDGNEIWVGVVRANKNSSLNEDSWIRENTREFSVAIPTDIENTTLVFLKKNFLPVTVPLTADLVEDRFELEFTRGISIFGNVSNALGVPITEGSVSLDRILPFEFEPPDPELLSWAIAEDGTFEMHGLRSKLKYVVTATAPEYMPGLEEVVLSADQTRREVSFELARATYITGRIVDRYEAVVRGEFNTVVTPIESQTTEILTKFDRDDHFRIGPFAEGVTVNLTAHDDLDRRTKVVEIQTPATDVQMLMLRWLPITGTVLNRNTSEPVTEFQLASRNDFSARNWIDVSAPDGQFEEEIDELGTGFVIMAPSFAYWESSRQLNLKERDSYDLGVVELTPAHTVRGRVLDSSSRLPIADAELRRSVSHEGVRSYWVFGNIKTTTDAEGEFELAGFTLDGDKLSVHKPGYRITTLLVEDVESDLEIELEPQNGSISGRVVSEDGSPIHPAYISIGAYSKLNEEDGSFSIIYVSGNVRLRASADGGRSDELEVTVENGQHITDVELTIKERGLGRVHGTVEGLADGEIARIIVGNVRESYVESDGTYEVRGIPIGEYVVMCRTISGPHYLRTLERTLEMDETLDARIDFAFEGKSSISGRIVLAGNPAGGLEIQATPENERHVQSQATTLGDGTYVIEGLDEGDYDVLVTARGVSQHVAVSGHTNVDFDLGSNELSGHVQASGSVRGMRVYLTGFGSGGRFQLSTTVDNSGYYQFQGLARGRYEVIVDHDSIKRVTRKVEIENSLQDFDVFVQPVKSKQKEPKTSKLSD